MLLQIWLLLLCAPFLTGATLPSNLVDYGQGRVYDTISNLMWQFLSVSSLPGIPDKVQATFSAQLRPATVAEFNNLLRDHGNATYYDSLLSTLNKGGAATSLYGIVFDPAGQSWSTRQASPGTFVIGGTNSFPTTSSLPNVGVWGVSWHCSNTTGQPVNILSSYPGIVMLTDTTIDACLCKSTYSGPSCEKPTTLATSAVCQDSTPVQTSITDGRQTVMVKADQTDSTAVVTIAVPQMVTRAYTSGTWGGCGFGLRGADSGLVSAVTLTSDTACKDVYQFKYRIKDLVTACGLARTENAADHDGYVRFSGDLTLIYSEVVQVPEANSSVVRSGAMVSPVTLYLNTTAEATTAPGRPVIYSPFQLQAAITGTRVKADATTSLAMVTLALMAPYTVVHINAPPYSAPNSNEPALADVCLMSHISTNPACAPAVDWTTDSGLSNCSPDDYVGGVCSKSVTLQLTHGAACSLDHDIIITGIGVYCATQFSGPDCPLGSNFTADTDSTSTLRFTIRANRFCSGQRAMVINDAITIKSWNLSRELTREETNTSRRAFAMGDMAYFILYLDRAKSLEVKEFEVIAFQTKLSSMGAFVQPSQANTRILETEDEENNLLGFDIATQTHLMRMQLDSYFVQDTDGNPLLVVGPTGESPPVFAQLIFSVGYDAGTRRRRRRSRVGGNQEQGQAAIITSLRVSHNADTEEYSGNDIQYITSNAAPSIHVTIIAWVFPLLLTSYLLA